MPSFLVVKVLDSQSVSLPGTSIYGAVELRSHKSDSDCEVDALKESAKNNRLDFDKFQVCARIATIVNCSNETEAADVADRIFSEVLDVKSVEIFISNFQISDIGYIKNLDNGGLTPICRRGYEPSMSFMVNQGDIQCFDNANYVLALNNELSNRYLRSLHWVRNGKHEKNPQLKILFYWFAIEALVKESENDNIGWVIRLFLGFPNRRYGLDVSTSLLQSLASHPRYDFWKRNLPNIVEKIRIFRNDSVHSGFRSVDFTKYDLELYNQIMIFSALRCQSAARVALINKIDTASEFKEYVGVIFDKNICAVNDIHGNIIHSLERIFSEYNNWDWTP